MTGRRRKGVVVREEGKYLLEVEGERQEIPLETVMDESQLESIVGQTVEVLYSEPRPAVVGILARERVPILCYVPWPPWPPCFLCYLPVPWLLRGVEREVQVNLAKRFLEEGYINEEVFERLV